jgi:hypothetical protein
VPAGVEVPKNVSNEEEEGFKLVKYIAVATNERFE